MSTLFMTTVCASNRSRAFSDIARLLAIHSKPFCLSVRSRNPSSELRRQQISSWDEFDSIVNQVGNSEFIISYDAAIHVDEKPEPITVEMLGDRFPINGFRRPGRLELLGSALPFSLEFTANTGILGEARNRFLREWKPIQDDESEMGISGSDAIMVAMFMYLCTNTLVGLKKLFIVLEGDFGSPSEWCSVIYKNGNSILRDIAAVNSDDVSEAPDFACRDDVGFIDVAAGIDVKIWKMISEAVASCKGVAVFTEKSGPGILITGHLDSQLKGFFECCAKLLSRGIYDFEK
jgi:hypothetical protein